MASFSGLKIFGQILGENPVLRALDFETTGLGSTSVSSAGSAGGRIAGTNLISLPGLENIVYGATTELRGEGFVSSVHQLANPDPTYLSAQKGLYEKFKVGHINELRTLVGRLNDPEIAARLEPHLKKGYVTDDLLKAIANLKTKGGTPLGDALSQVGTVKLSQGAGTFGLARPESYAEILRSQLAGSLIIGHNVSRFDKALLEGLTSAHGGAKPARMLDTLYLSESILTPDKLGGYWRKFGQDRPYALENLVRLGTEKFGDVPEHVTKAFQESFRGYAGSSHYAHIDNEAAFRVANALGLIAEKDPLARAKFTDALRRDGSMPGTVAHWFRQNMGASFQAMGEAWEAGSLPKGNYVTGLGIKENHAFFRQVNKVYGQRYAKRLFGFYSSVSESTGGKLALAMRDGGLWIGAHGAPTNYAAGGTLKGTFRGLPAQALDRGAQRSIMTRGSAVSVVRNLRYGSRSIAPSEMFLNTLEQHLTSALGRGPKSAFRMIPEAVAQTMKVRLRGEMGTIPGLTLGQAVEGAAFSVRTTSPEIGAALATHRTAHLIQNPEDILRLAKEGKSLPAAVPADPGGGLSSYYQLGMAKKQALMQGRSTSPLDITARIKDIYSQIAQETGAVGTLKPEHIMKAIVPETGIEGYFLNPYTEAAQSKGVLHSIGHVMPLSRQAEYVASNIPGVGLKRVLQTEAEEGFNRLLQLKPLRKRLDRLTGRATFISAPVIALNAPERFIGGESYTLGRLGEIFYRSPTSSEIRINLKNVKHIEEAGALLGISPDQLTKLADPQSEFRAIKGSGTTFNVNRLRKLGGIAEKDLAGLRGSYRAVRAIASPYGEGSLSVWLREAGGSRRARHPGLIVGNMMRSTVTRNIFEGPLSALVVGANDLSKLDPVTTQTSHLLELLNLAGKRPGARAIERLGLVQADGGYRISPLTDRWKLRQGTEKLVREQFRPGATISEAGLYKPLREMGIKLSPSTGIEDILKGIDTSRIEVVNKILHGKLGSNQGTLFLATSLLQRADDIADIGIGRVRITAEQMRQAAHRAAVLGYTDKMEDPVYNYLMQETKRSGWSVGAKGIDLRANDDLRFMFGSITMREGSENYLRAVEQGRVAKIDSRGRLVTKANEVYHIPTVAELKKGFSTGGSIWDKSVNQTKVLDLGRTYKVPIEFGKSKPRTMPMRFLGLPNPKLLEIKGGFAQAGERDLAVKLLRVMDAVRAGRSEGAVEKALGEYTEAVLGMTGKESPLADKLFAHTTTEGRLHRIVTMDPAYRKILEKKMQKHGFTGGPTGFDRLAPEKQIRNLIGQISDQKARTATREFYEKFGYVPVAGVSYPPQKASHIHANRLWGSNRLKTGAGEVFSIMDPITQLLMERDQDLDFMSEIVMKISDSSQLQATRERIDKVIKKQAHVAKHDVQLLRKVLEKDNNPAQMKEIIDELIRTGRSTDQISNMVKLVSQKETAPLGYLSTRTSMMWLEHLGEGTVDQTIRDLVERFPHKTEYHNISKDIVNNLRQNSWMKHSNFIAHAQEATQNVYQAFVQKAETNTMSETLDKIYALRRNTELVGAGPQAFQRAATRIIEESDIISGEISKHEKLAVTAGKEAPWLGKSGNILERGRKSIANLLGAVYGYSSYVSAAVEAKTGKPLALGPISTEAVTQGVAKHNILDVVANMLGVEPPSYISAGEQVKATAETYEQLARHSERGGNVAKALDKKLFKVGETLKQVYNSKYGKAAIIGGTALAGFALLREFFGGDEYEPPPMPTPSMDMSHRTDIPREPAIESPGSNMPSIRPMFGGNAAYLTPSISPVPSVSLSVDANRGNYGSAMELANATETMGYGDSFTSVEIREPSQANPYWLAQKVKEYQNSRFVV